ncbi:MAG: hypothetical protein IKW71_02725 [Elusimicrobiaceae bacterium]|nr:hypothetical protein [Elusimicrobiaceae bacterium]
MEDMSFMLDHWYDNKEKTPSEFVGKMYRWTDEHQRWPEEIKWEAPFTYSMYEEILLAKELQYFVSLLISNPSWNLTRTLSRPLPYPKVNLERLRRLYQQYNKAN